MGKNWKLKWKHEMFATTYILDLFKHFVDLFQPIYIFDCVIKELLKLVFKT